MAVKLFEQPGNFNEYPRSISRQGAYPLEREHLFFALGTPSDLGVSTAYGFAKNSPVAYVGQTIEVIDEDAGIIGFYQIQDTSGTLKQVGAELIGVGEDDSDESKGWSGGKIKDYIAKYVEENGGGGTYVPPSVGFGGLSSSVVEKGTAYSLVSFTVNISNPSSIRSAIDITCNGYSTSIPLEGLQATNTVLVSSLSNAQGRTLSISGSADEGNTSFTFNLTCTDRSGPITASGTFSVTGAAYMYIGRTSAESMTPAVMVSDAFVSNSGTISQTGRQLCNGSTFNTSIVTLNNDYIWLCVPSTKTLTSVVMNGFNVTDAFTANRQTVNGVTSHTNKSISDYICYRSALQAANAIQLAITLT